MSKFTVYHQHDSMQCGVTCLRMVCKHFGREYSTEYLSNLCFATNEGVSMLGISEATERLGLHTVCGLVRLDMLAKLPLPCIMHWNQNHFVVLYKIGRGEQKYYIADPGKGLITYGRDEMADHWVSTRSDGKDKGVAMFLTTTPAFYEHKNDCNTDKGESRSLHFLFGYIKNHSNLCSKVQNSEQTYKLIIMKCHIYHVTNRVTTVITDWV